MPAFAAVGQSLGNLISGFALDEWYRVALVILPLRLKSKNMSRYNYSVWYKASSNGGTYVYGSVAEMTDLLYGVTDCSFISTHRSLEAARLTAESAASQARARYAPKPQSFRAVAAAEELRLCKPEDQL